MAPRRNRNQRPMKRRPARRGRGLPRPTQTNGGLMSIAKTMVLPDRMLVRLPYTDNYTKTQSYSGGGISQVWNLNSIFDPDRTGAGHQPLGRDSFLPLYNYYRVVSAKYNIEINNTAGLPLQFGLIKAPFAVGAFGNAAGQALMEQPHTQRKLCGGFPGNTSSIRFTGSVSLPAVIGQSSQQYKSHLATAAAQGANPLTLACLNLISLAPTSSSASYTYSVSIRIVYLVEYFGRVALPLSNTKPTDGDNSTMSMTPFT